MNFYRSCRINSRDHRNCLIHPGVSRQGTGRQDIPASSEVLYCSTSKCAAIAEFLQPFRNSQKFDKCFTQKDLELADDTVQGIVTFDLVKPVDFIDLCDPKKMTELNLHPKDIASGDREITQRTAQMIFDGGHHGFLWWSSLEAKWVNATFFLSRIKSELKPVHSEPLTMTDPDFLEAARLLNVTLDDDGRPKGSMVHYRKKR